MPTVRKVVPNSVQPVSLRDPGSARPSRCRSACRRPRPGPGVRPVTNLVPPRKISFGNPAAAAAAHPSAPEPAAPPPAPEPAYVPASVPTWRSAWRSAIYRPRAAELLAGGAVDRAAGWNSAPRNCIPT